MFLRKVILSLLIMVLLVAAGPAQWLHHVVDHAPGHVHAHAMGDTHHAHAHAHVHDAHATLAPSAQGEAEQEGQSPPGPEDDNCVQCFLIAQGLSLQLLLAELCYLQLTPAVDRLTPTRVHQPARRYLSDLAGRDPPAFLPTA